MNTTTAPETAVQAVSDKAAHDAARQAQTVIDQAQTASQADEAQPFAPQAPAAELRFIALSRLRLSKRNVRKTAAPVEALAESIARDQTIPCLVVPDASAVTVSLTENVQRQDMHPADQFEAFLALVHEGRPIEDIAGDFGVTPLVVQRRLKLARVSPRLMTEYRQGGVTLEQLMVLTLADDHQAQEAAFYDAPAYERDPYALRRRLTHCDVDAARSPLARFVSVDAYTAAGGGIRRDLFAQDGEGITLTDAGLLGRLAADKLETLAAEVSAPSRRAHAGPPRPGILPGAAGNCTIPHRAAYRACRPSCAAQAAKLNTTPHRDGPPMPAGNPRCVGKVRHARRTGRAGGEYAWARPGRLPQLASSPTLAAMACR